MTMPPEHARGTFGEHETAFFLGERGYFFVEGPSGTGDSAKGHQLTHRGFDGVAYNPTLRHLIIYDNKALKEARNLSWSEATSTDRMGNLGRNLDDLIERVHNMNDMPHKREILNLLYRTRMAVTLDTHWPYNVDVAITNAGGRIRGVVRPSSKGPSFIDVYSAPTPLRPNSPALAPTNYDLWLAIGMALGALAQWIGDIGIRRTIERQLKNELAPRIQDILKSGEGVLIVVLLQEDAQAGEIEERGRLLLGVYVHSGRTKESAQADWENTPKLLPGASKGWRFVTRYGWIPSLNP